MRDAGELERAAKPPPDFSIQPESLPIVSFVDVLSGDPATLQKLKGKKIIIGATAIELGDQFPAFPTAASFRAPSCRCWPRT